MNGEDLLCRVCNHQIETRPDCEPIDICDPCAQTELIKITEATKKLIEAAQEACGWFSWFESNYHGAFGRETKRHIKKLKSAIEAVKKEEE